MHARSGGAGVRTRGRGRRSSGRPRARLFEAVSACALVGLLTALPAGATAQVFPPGAEAEPDESGIRIAITGYGAGSVRQGFSGVRIAQDMVSYGGRVTWIRSFGSRPWIDGGAFFRPHFECPPERACTDEGWLARAGVTLPITPAGASGFQAALLAGVGAAVAEEASPSYLFGLTFHWPLVPHLSPVLELRWEHLVEINFTMLAVGARLDL